MPFSKVQCPVATYINAVIILFFLVSSVQSQSLVYEEKRGDETYTYHYQFHELDDGYHIDVCRLHGSDTTDKQVLVTDSEFRTRSWKYIRFGENTEVVASLSGDGVSIRGLLDGEKLDEFEELDEEEPWIQLFPMNPGFEQFVFSDEDELVFWSIGTESPADMEINSFDAEKEEKEYNEEFGCTVLRVNFSPTGWKSWFWDGDYYFRAEDGRVVGYRGDGAPGKPSSKTTLIDEK